MLLSASVKVSPQRTIRSPHVFGTPNALPVASLLFYPGLGLALHPVPGVWELAKKPGPSAWPGEKPITEPLMPESHLGD